MNSSTGPAAYRAPEFEKSAVYDDKASPIGESHYDVDVEHGSNGELKKSLKNRHMQMIAIGGAIGAGYFVGSGAALATGGPASLIICFGIIGIMLLLTMQALAELGVLFPVNGAFFTYATRFINRSWGFAMGWDYAIQWLTILPFELNAAAITIAYWEQDRAPINPGAWIALFLGLLIIIQFFGVRGYGEVEFVLSIVKVTATVGFMILAVIINCGGVPTDNRGYIGGRFYYPPYSNNGFLNGFKGFCSVFVTASFAFGGTELVGLAAAEAANPMKSIPKATKQVFWRITFFYVVGLALVGLVLDPGTPALVDNSGAYARASPFVQAIVAAGIPALDSIFNAVILLAVISVANSCTYGSTRTMQALAIHGMAPKFLAKIDKAGRPIYCVIIQVLFGFLAFVIEADSDASGKFFTWLLSLSGLINFFTWGSICFSHIRFRAGWKAQGRSLDEIPYRAPFGIIGSSIGLGMNMLCIAATFYTSMWPIGKSPDPYTFFSNFLAAPVIIFLYLSYKIWTRDWTLFVKAADMDVTTGLRSDLAELTAIRRAQLEEKTWGNLPKRIAEGLF